MPVIDDEVMPSLRQSVAPVNEDVMPSLRQSSISQNDEVMPSLRDSSANVPKITISPSVLPRNSDELAASNFYNDPFHNTLQPATGTTPLQAAGKVLNYAGNVARAIPTDVEMGILQPSDTYGEQFKNTIAAAKGESVLPQDKTIASISKQYPASATFANIGQGALSTAPLLLAGGLPSIIQKAVALGFSAQMIAGVKDLATQYGDEMGKPESQRNPAKLAQLRSDLIQTGIFAPLAGTHGVKPFVDMTGANGFTPEQIKDSGDNLSRPASLQAMQPPMPSSEQPLQSPRNIHATQTTPETTAPSGVVASRFPLDSAQQSAFDKLRPQGATPPAVLSETAKPVTLVETPTPKRTLPAAPQIEVMPIRTSDVTSGIDFANIQQAHKVGVEAGLPFSKDNVDDLKVQQFQANLESQKALENGDDNAFKAAFGKSTYLQGVIEGAQKSGANYDAYVKEQGISQGEPLQNETKQAQERDVEIQSPTPSLSAGEPTSATKPEIGMADRGLDSTKEANPNSGIISGTEVESWADNIIKQSRGRLNVGLDPQLLSAYAVKGAALIERGIRNVAAWTKQMMQEHGLTRDQALRVWIISKRLLDKGRQTNARRIVEITTGIDPETGARPMTQADVAGIQQKASAQAFKAGKVQGATDVHNEPENVSLKQRINQTAETQLPIGEARTKSQALQDKLSDSIAKSAALNEYYAGQEKASAQGAAATRKDLAIADKWSAADSENIRQSLLDLVKTLPLKERGRFVSSITEAAKRPTLLSPDSDGMYQRAATVAARIMNHAEDVHRNSVVSDIKDTVAKAIKSPSVDVGYKAKILQAIRRVGLQGISEARILDLKGTRDYIARAGDQNTVPDAVMRQLDILSKTPAKDLPLNVLESIRDKVNLLEQLGRTMTRTREHLYENEKEALARDMRASSSRPMNDAAQKRSPGAQLSLGEKIKQSFGNKLNAAFDYAKRTGRALTGRDVMLDVLDGDANYDGALNRNVGGRLDADYNSEMNLRQALHAPFKDLDAKFGKYSPLELERISIHAIAKEDGGLDRLKASGVTPETIKSVVGNLTPKEQAFYDSARNTFDTQVFPQLQKFMRDNYNVEVTPVKNYWPFQRDNALVEADKTPAPPIENKEGKEVGFDEMETPRQLLGDFAPRKTTKTEQGMTIERIPDAQGAVKLDASEVVNRHLNDFAHLISTQRNLKMLGELTRQDWFKQKYGSLGRDYVQNLLDTVARNSAPIGSTRTAWLDGLTKNTSVAIIGLRLLSQMKHAPNAAFSLKNVGWNHLARGLVDSFTPSGKAFIQKNFAEIFQRFGGEPAIEQLMHGGVIRKVQAASFVFERALDSLNARATVLGKYMGEMAKKGIDPKIIYDLPVDKEAQRKALLVSRQSVTSPLLKDQPQAITRGSLTGNNISFSRALFQFQSTMLRQAAYMKHDILDLGIKKMDIGQIAGASLAFLAMLAAETTIVQANKQLLGKKQPDKEKEGLAHGMAIEALKRIPGAGNIVSMAEYGETGVPTADTLITGTKAVYHTVSGKNDYDKTNSARQEKIAKADALTFAGEVAGVPGASTAGQIYKNKFIPPTHKK